MRMDRRCFTVLCHLLRTIARLVSTKIIDVEEMVEMFFHVLTHDVENRVIQREFTWSDETISQHFNKVLLAVLRLRDELLKKPQPITNCCTIHDGSGLRFVFYTMQNYLGALGGRYISKWMFQQVIGRNIEHERVKLPQMSLEYVIENEILCSY